VRFVASCTVQQDRLSHRPLPGGPSHVILTALLGAIVLEDLDLLVDRTAQRVVPHDPRGAIYETE